VYGLLGLAPPNLVKEIRPRYDLPVGEVYKQAFLAQLKLVGRLETFHTCNSVTRKIDGPSWVPDWSTPRINRVLADSFFASGHSRAHVTYRPPGILEMTGVSCAVVKAVSKPAPLNAQEFPNIVRQWVPDNLQARYILGGSLLDAYASTLLVNHFKERYPLDQWPSFVEWKQFILNRMTPSAAEGATDFSSDRSMYSAVGFIKDRSLIKFEEGYIGLGPAAAQPGRKSIY
jgi:hypothetical protein